MTLEERIENVLLKYEIAREESKVKMIESITEEFAIGFAEWINLNCDEFLETDQQLLLRVYKKEKGL